VEVLTAKLQAIDNLLETVRTTKKFVYLVRRISRMLVQMVLLRKAVVPLYSRVSYTHNSQQKYLCIASRRKRMGDSKTTAIKNSHERENTESTA
jgi:hypothetical protein